MKARTSTERSTEFRTKKREAGYEYLHTWVHSSKKAEFLAFVEKLNEEK